MWVPVAVWQVRQWTAISISIDFICLRHRPLRGVDSVRLQSLLIGTCWQCMVHGVSLQTPLDWWRRSMLPVTDLLMLLMLTASFRRACVRAWCCWWLVGRVNVGPTVRRSAVRQSCNYWHDFAVVSDLHLCGSTHAHSYETVVVETYMQTLY